VQRSDIRKLQVALVVDDEARGRIRRPVRRIRLTHRGSQFRVIPDRNLQHVSWADLVRTGLAVQRRGAACARLCLHRALLLHRCQRDVGDRDLLLTGGLAIVSITDG